MTEQRINIMEPQKPAEQAVQTEPANQTPKIVYAPITDRFVALLIDYGIIFIPGQFIGNWIFKMLGDRFDVFWLCVLLGSINLSFILYEAVFSSGNRTTLGKKLVGIAVVRQDLEGPISFSRAFLRAVGYYISTILLFCGFVIAFFDDRHRALHDFLGGSVVVQMRPKEGWEKLLLRILGSVLLAAFAWFVYVQFFGNGKLDDQISIRRARAHLRKIAVLEEGHFARYGTYTNDLLRLSLLSGDPVQFQRDTQKVLEPKGFKIGVKGKGYKIKAVAKDKDHTVVVYESEP